MKNTNNQFYFLFTTLVFLTGCSLLKNVESILPNKDSESKKVVVKETLQVTISCNKDNIQSYLDQGWEIDNSIVSEVPCTWKTSKATKNCSPKKDKGCLITIPDIMGSKTIYQLSRDKKSQKRK